MSKSNSNRIIDFFAVHSRDLTPAPIRHAATILYAPVSNEAEITRCCESVLSETERRRAERFTTSDDRRLFLQRRAFRRFCGSRSLGSLQSLSRDIFEETENGRPYLVDQPDVSFSFSSCRSGILGAWSPWYGIGVDIEDCTRNPGAIELARRYFSVAEARSIEGRDDRENQRSFFRLWSLKEAALKSIGEGMPYGLSAFEFELEPNLRVVHAPADHGGAERFRAHLIEETENSIAIILGNRLI
jgi:phosphopantetheine--protein transferase-like protein